ncbi:MAG: lactate utilization protein C [Betaproteobacteria bacterium]|nr:MAG: lactate utilization protein C [Betaproteobacteria bacterium]
MSAKENILARIRSANAMHAAAGDVSFTPSERLSAHPRGPMPTMQWDALERFKACSIAAASTVDELSTRADIPAAVARYLKQNNLPMSGVCWPEFGDLDWHGAGLEMQPRPAAGDDKVGVTGSFCALAETGTLVLLSGESQAATTSLLPETHIAVISTSRVVVSMEDVWELMREEIGELPRQVNFVSGPSRTADIEMTLVYGAHGPFRVHVLLLDE